MHGYFGLFCLIQHLDCIIKFIFFSSQQVFFPPFSKSKLCIIFSNNLVFHAAMFHLGRKIEEFFFTKSVADITNFFNKGYYSCFHYVCSHGCFPRSTVSKQEHVTEFQAVALGIQLTHATSGSGTLKSLMWSSVYLFPLMDIAFRTTLKNRFDD